MPTKAGKAQACIIWMHGLGADASDMAGLADQLVVDNLSLHHVFLDAPKRPVTINGGMVMPAWYDILGNSLTDREDKEGIQHSEALITKAIQAALQQGFQSKQIFLAGFSQGGAMALHTALNTSMPLGGVIALSAYLPLIASQASLQDKTTPFFMAAGQFDSMILPTWTNQSRLWLEKAGYSQLTYHQYPMEHSLCWEELQDIATWLKTHVKAEVTTL
jgi:phospholipase/carboxylesterase